MESAYFRAPGAQWGFASSPIIYENLVIVQCDVMKNSFWAAFDIKDGREVWRTPRNDVPTWSTPTVGKTENRTQIIVNGFRHMGGYDLATGKSGFTASPVAADGKLYQTSEDGEVYVIKIGTEYSELAVNPMGEICMATPAISEGRLYFRTRGHLVAVGK